MNEQATQAWGVDQAVLYRPKGRSVTTELFLTLGVAANDGMVLHWRLMPPHRAWRLEPYYEASELP